MKIAVLGYAGSGKTYLSDYISEKKNIPVMHLDSVKWDKEWKQIDNAVVLPQVSQFMMNDNWIIDGYYDYLFFDERLEQADLIVLLLLPRLTCFYRTVKRTKSRRQNGYKNDLNWWFVKFTLFGCRNKERRQIYARIAEKYKDKTVVLKTKRRVSEFIKNIQDECMCITKDIDGETDANTSISFMTVQALESICSWKYPQPYDIYDFMPYKEALKKDVAILKQENRENYLCFWENNVLVAYINFYFINEKLFFGIGLSPENCGKGLGKTYLKNGIKEAIKRYPDKSLWIQVRSWNQRAIKCYECCGFKEQYKEITKDRNGNETEFVFMCLEVKT